MSSYDSSHNARRTRGRQMKQGDAHLSERDQRRAERMQRRVARSVGADSLAAPTAHALGLAGRNVDRPRGRGETARRVEQDRSDNVSARPAVYTKEAKGLRDRLHLPAFSFSVQAVVIAAIAIAVAVALIYGPARTYYSAWRDSGILQAEYNELTVQNQSLNHELDRLQTLEGIEDEARGRGYVYPGEEALVVKGVEEEAVADPERVEEAVRAYEQSLPWYVSVLDMLFGYQHE